MFTVTVDTNDVEGANDAKAEALVRAWMHEIGDFVEDLFVQKVPYASGRTLHAVRQGRINKTPYGYTMEVGVGQIFGLKYDESPDYPLFVHEGTGIFANRADGSSDAGLITPQHGNVIAFEKLGEGTVYTKWVQGQRAQPYLDEITEESDAYITVKKAELAAALNALI